MNALLTICAVTLLPAAAYDISDFIVSFIAKVEEKDRSPKVVADLICKAFTVIFFITFLLIWNLK